MAKYLNLKDEIKQFCLEKNMTFKELAEKSNMSERGLHNKFYRDSLTVKDLRQILDVLGKEMVFKDKEIIFIDKSKNNQDKK